LISRVLLPALLFFAAAPLHAWDSLQVELRFYRDPAGPAEPRPAETHRLLSAALPELIDAKLKSLYADAYLGTWYHAGEADSAGRQRVDFYLGEPYYLIRLGPGTLEPPMRNRVGYRDRFYRNRPFRHTEVLSLFENILEYAENHGYPFATVALDSLQIEGNGIRAVVRYEPGPLIVFDSLRTGDFRDIRPSFLQAQLGLYRGRAFDQGMVDQIPRRLKQMEFVTLAGDPDLRFQEERVGIDLALSRRSVNQVDAVLGLLPNENEPGKVLITGLVMLNLHNLFSSAKNLRLEWQRTDISSQLLDIDYRHPKLLHSPVDFEGGFHLLKQDTTFINREASLRFSFITGVAGELAVGSRFQSSGLLSTSAYAGADRLPAYADFNLGYHGLEYRYSTFDDPVFPTRGVQFSIEGFAGQKKIRQNPALDPGLYEGIKLNSAQYRTAVQAEAFSRIYRNILLRSRLMGGYLDGSSLFQNDLFRLGGLNSLRGFNENFFFASSYLIGNLELRFLLEQGTYFFAFLDQGLIVNRPAGAEPDYPTGLGAGLSLATEAGNFNLAFALGRSNAQAMALNLSKIHFGYVSRF
jgi:outer membrane protein assembly factor BamA